MPTNKPTDHAKASAQPAPLVQPPLGLQDRRDDFNVIFIHSRLDEYGLSPQQFRVYAHLARRASSGRAYPSVATLARVCQVHAKTVRQALHVLVVHRLVTRVENPGHPADYYITPAREWQPPVNINGHPSQTDTDEGNPIEGDPKKVQTPIPPKGDCAPAKASSASTQAEEIYAAYPRKVGKPAALRAIRNALKTNPPEFLLDRTKLYAATYNGEARYIPHPATWFNQARFNDDPATWSGTGGVRGKAPPAIIRPEKFGCGVSKL